MAPLKIYLLYLFIFIPVGLVRKKWKNLKDNFRTEIKIIGADKTGDVTKSLTKKKWKWFDSLLFLKSCYEGRIEGCYELEEYPMGEQPNLEQTIEKYYVEEQFVDDKESVISETSVSSNFFVSQNSVIKKEKELEAPMIDNEKQKFELVGPKCNEEEKDSTYYFLMSLREPINTLPISSQMNIRMKFQEILAKEFERHQFHP